MANYDNRLIVEWRVMRRLVRDNRATARVGFLRISEDLFEEVLRFAFVDWYSLAPDPY